MHQIKAVFNGNFDYIENKANYYQDGSLHSSISIPNEVFDPLSIAYFLIGYHYFDQLVQKKLQYLIIITRYYDKVLKFFLYELVEIVVTDQKISNG